MLQTRRSQQKRCIDTMAYRNIIRGQQAMTRFTKTVQPPSILAFGLKFCLSSALIRIKSPTPAALCNGVAVTDDIKIIEQTTRSCIAMQVHIGSSRPPAAESCANVSRRRILRQHLEVLKTAPRCTAGESALSEPYNLALPSAVVVLPSSRTCTSLLVVLLSALYQ